MSAPSVDNQPHQNVDNESVRSSILEIASVTGALCALAVNPMFPSHNTDFPVDVPRGIGASLLDISVEVIKKLLDICGELDLVLSRCIFQKLVINNCKYPAALCRVRSVFAHRKIGCCFGFCRTHFICFSSLHFQGSVDKYTAYRAETGVTKENQSISLDDVSASSVFGQENEKGDFANSVLPLTAYLVEFVRVRDWTKFDTPRNLVLAMLGEVGELAEVMQWKGDLRGYDKIKNDRVVDKLSQEVSDVAIYLLRVVWVCNLTESLHQRLVGVFSSGIPDVANSNNGDSSEVFFHGAAGYLDFNIGFQHTTAASTNRELLFYLFDYYTRHSVFKEMGAKIGKNPVAFDAFANMIDSAEFKGKILIAAKDLAAPDNGVASSNATCNKDGNYIG
jgi:NTP pyrophosphatase (non-canonical NTP hydrolase)